MAADRVGEIFGNYTLVRLLGQGSFAEVYLGEHRYLERPAAIKVLHVRMQQPATHEAFRAEAKLIARLQHPHLVQILDFGIEGETPYLVMDYAPNGTLRSRHPSGTPLAWEQILSYVKQIAEALDYAHAQHIIHRDIKPDNLLLNAKDEIVISDFGIAVVQHTLDSFSTQNRAGTPLYMAPEQIQQHPCTASDQYAVGIMVYEWLCGEPPFPGPGLAIFAQHLYQEPPRLRDRVPDLPLAVEDAVFGALAKDPGQRFATVQDFALVLEEAFFATQPLRISHPSLALTPVSVAPSIISPQQPQVDEQTQKLGNIPRIAPHVPGRPLTAPLTHQQSVPSQGKLSHEQKNRQRLLQRVRSFWIEGVLEHSLHGAALLALGLQTQPDAVANPWNLVLQHPETTPTLLPAGTSITQVYDTADGELLILGAPGSGKTTLLLELARDLIARAEQDEYLPLPIVFNLSSWGIKRQSLNEWIIEELISKYSIPRKLGQSLIETENILPLLDGLDEIPEKVRTACIETINTFRQAHGLQSLVVCSRSVDYLAQNSRVMVRTAVVIQPLSNQQVDKYLYNAGSQIAALRIALQQDPDLQELATTPLMLNILTLTYQGMPLNTITPFGSLAIKQKQVFSSYVQRMFIHHISSTNYSPQQTIYWLSHLARHMKNQSQTEFHIERLQPSWLPNHLWRRTFRGLVSGIVFGTVSGIIVGIASCITTTTTTGILNGVSAWLIASLLFFLLGYMVIDIREQELQPYDVQIYPAETIILSRASLWNSIGKGLFNGCLGTLLLWLIVIILLGEYILKNHITIPNALLFGSYIGVVILLVILDGLSSEQVDKSILLKPNQGIVFSMKNSIFIGAISGGLAGLVVGLIAGMLSGLIMGMIVGLIAGLRNGGFASIQHFLLRVCLWRVGFTPWNYTRFLNHATDHILLRKIGGGYIFVHRLLLEYFASLDDPSTPPSLDH